MNKSSKQLKIKKTPFFLFGLIIVFYSFNIRKEIEVGRYISTDKLQYITIKNKSMFEYNSYLYYSPYTIKEKRKKDINPNWCGSIGYWGNGKGFGKYSIKKDSLILEFDFSFSKISIERMDDKKNKTMSFHISDLEKLIK
ncbi:MAG: hypothetical protein COA67_01635 [Lutibacter sp.]|nr:MAG: hypothetical protein COA67_01635 [Lutibacter sp.]